MLPEDRTDNALPLYVLFYKLRNALEDLGPSYLGLDDMLDANQPWRSPLNLQSMADPATAMSIDDPANSPAGKTDGSLEPFSPPADTSSSITPPSRKRKRKAGASMEPIDMPSIIHMLIMVEQARQGYLAELTSRKHAQGSVGDQSERWLHHHAKRNTAAEIKFENVLVALKELALLRAVIDPSVAQLSELKSCLSRSDSKRGKTLAATPRDSLQALDYDATQCLAILNLMFPLKSLDPSLTNSAGSTSARGFAWGQLRQSCLTYLRDAQHKIATQHRAMNPWTPVALDTDMPHDDAGEDVSPGMEDVDNAECVSLSNDSGTGQDIAGPAATQENDKILSAVSAQCSRDATVVERIVRHSRLVGSRFSQHAFYNDLL
ncbi:hypothetical protein GGF42_008113 [Coemansia sp. RSA 2424]|nr:hypothetical protein GGF42_008113 [Coemansia sp. RSA 2424]